MEERKWAEVTFYLKPHLLEYVTGLCGQGPLVLDPYQVIGLAASTCLRRTKQAGNGAIRAGRKPLTFLLSRKQGLNYGRHVGNRELVAFERHVQLLLQRELIAYVQARRTQEPGIAIIEAIRCFLDARNISQDHVGNDALWAAVESDLQREARRRYRRTHYLTSEKPAATA